MLAFQAEHNILMHPFHMLGVSGIFAGALFSALHGSLVSSSLIRETTEMESLDAGYRFGQQEPTYNYLAGHYGYLGRVLIPPFASGNSRAFHFWMAALPTVGIWFAALGVGSMAFNLNGFNFQHSILDSSGKVIDTNADVINRATLEFRRCMPPMPTTSRCCWLAVKRLRSRWHPPWRYKANPL